MTTLIKERGKQMKQFIGTSARGNLNEAIRGLTNPELLILCVGRKESFQQAVTQLEEAFPNVPSIGCVGQSYGQTKVQEEGIMVTAFSGGITAITNVLTNVSTMPLKKIHQFERDAAAISAGKDNTVCLDFCSGNDEMVLTTISSVLLKKQIPLTGGTAWDGLVSANGIVYEDACAYALIKNNTGKVKVYKENLYQPTDKRFLVTKSIPSQYIISELDGKPAEKVYMNELGIGNQEFSTQTFKNPLGHCLGEEIYIVSLKETTGNGQFSCYRKVNPKTTLSILQIGDTPQIVNQTIAQIKQDFPRISGIFSINCLFRYLMFQEQHYMDTYLKQMGSLGTHAGLIGLGEHYNEHHTNQTMSCVVFE